MSHDWSVTSLCMILSTLATKNNQEQRPTTSCWQPTTTTSAPAPWSPTFRHPDSPWWQSCDNRLRTIITTHPIDPLDQFSIEIIIETKFNADHRDLPSSVRVHSAAPCSSPIPSTATCTILDSPNISIELFTIIFGGRGYIKSTVSKV